MNIAQKVKFERPLYRKILAVHMVFVGFFYSAAFAAGDIKNVAQTIVHPDKNTVARMIERFGIGGEIGLTDLGLADGAGIQAGWRFDVEPSYREGLISRIDEFYFGSSSIPGLNLFPASMSDMGFGNGLGIDIRCKFIKQYLDGWSATKDITYLKNFLRINKFMPLDAERALSKMHPGDYFSIRLPMTLTIGYSQAKKLVQNLPVNKNVGYSLSGLFEFHIAKLMDNKVQMKLVFINGKKANLDIDGQYSGVLSVTPISYINKRVTKILKLSPVRFSLQNSKDQLFMADYILDLSQPEVSQAYDQVLAPLRKIWEGVKVASPKVTFFQKNVNKNAEKMKNNLRTSIEPLDRVVANAIAKQNENNGEFSAIRLFKGSNYSVTNSFALHLGTKLFSFDGASSSGQNDITSFNSTGEVVNSHPIETEAYYHADTEIYENSKSAGLNYWDLTEHLQLTAVFDADQTFENKKVAGIVIANEPRDKQFSASDFEKTKQHLAATLPPLVYKRIRFEQWQFPEKTRHAVGYRSKLVLSPEFVQSLPSLGQKQMYSLYMLYIEKLEKENIYRRPKISDDEVKQLQDFSFEDQVYQISNALSIASNSAVDPIQRLQAFISLKKNRVFTQTGIRFILELVPIEKLNGMIFFDLEMNSSDDDKLKFSFGSDSDSRSYQKVINILEIINNEGLDIIMTAQKVASEYLHKPPGQ